jgi:hypothetical protein
MNKKYNTTQHPKLKRSAAWINQKLGVNQDAREW